MRLSQLLEGVTTKEKIGDMDIDITNIHSDSRKIKENALFVMKIISEAKIIILTAPTKKACESAGFFFSIPRY